MKILKAQPVVKGILTYIGSYHCHNDVTVLSSSPRFNESEVGALNCNESKVGALN